MASKLGITGLQAVFLIKEFERNQKIYDKSLKNIADRSKQTAAAVNKSGSEMGKTFDDFVQKVANSGRATGAFFNSLGNLDKIFQKIQGREIDFDTFIKGLDEGKSVTEAFKDAATGAADENKKLATSLKAAGAAATLYSVAIGASLKLVKDSISEYADFAKQVRQVRLELGSSAEEASGWARAAQLSGVSATSLDRAITSIEKKMINYRLALLDGKETSNTFTRALGRMKISMVDGNDELKSGTDIMEEVQLKFQELGDGAITSGLAMDLFGFSGRQLLPLLVDQEKSIADLQKRATELGATLTEDDIKAYKEWKEATFELELATTGLKTYIARQWIPILTDTARILTEVVNWYRRAVAGSVAWVHTLRALGTSVIKISDAVTFYDAKLQQLLGVENEAARATRALEQAQNKARQEMILTGEATEDLIEKQQKLIDKLNELEADYADKQEDIALRFSRKWADIETKRWFDAIERSIRFNGKLNELAIKHQQKLADIQGKRGSGVKEAQDETNKKLRDADRDAQEKREKLERTHRDRLVDIRNDYLDTVEEAARSNDAVAVLKARRRQAIAIRDEGLKNSRSQRELNIDLNSKRDQIREDAVEKAKEEQDNYDEQIARANLAYQRQVDALKRKSIEDAAVLALKYREEKQQFDEAKRRAFEDALTWYNREQEALTAQIAALRDIAVTGIAETGAAMAVATGSAISQIFAAAMAAMPQAFSQGQRENMAGVFGSGTEGGSGGGMDAWYRRSQPGGYRARGGFDIARKPTRYMAGEEGTPEAAIFIPMRNGTLNHNFGNMDLNFNGLPPGMDQSQVTAIVMEVMMSIAQQV